MALGWAKKNTFTEASSLAPWGGEHSPRAISCQAGADPHQRVKGGREVLGVWKGLWSEAVKTHPLLCRAQLWAPFTPGKASSTSRTEGYHGPKGVPRPCTSALQHETTNPRCCKGQWQTFPPQATHILTHWILYFLLEDSQHQEDQMEGSHELSLGPSEMWCFHCPSMFPHEHSIFLSFSLFFFSSLIKYINFLGPTSNLLWF